MSETMLYEDYLRMRIERGDFGVAIIPASIAEDMANWMDNQRDRIEIVRCKDCEYWYPEEDDAYGHCRKHDFWTSESWFCADGERRCDEN